MLEQVVELIGEGQQSPSGHIPFTPRAKKVLELSLREALQLGHNYIGTEHILLGLVREGEGVAAQVLVKLDAELPKVRKTVISLLSGPGGAAVRELEPSGGVRRGSARSSDPTSLVLDRISRSDPDELELYRRLIERIQTRDRTSSGGDQIRISGIEVMAHHGVYPEEKEIGQRFLIGLKLTLDLSKAAGSDQLEDTVDYERLVL